MFTSIIKKINLIIKVKKTNQLKYECIKITLLYMIIGFLWIYYSDRLVNKITSNSGMLLTINTYKGWIYVIITSTIIYLLISRLVNKVNLAEKKLSESYEELAAVNEELEAYVQQLRASEEELRVQYDQIIENEKKLRESENRNRAIVEAIPDLLFVINNEGIFIDCMVSNESLLLQPKKSFIGKTIFEIMPKEISRIANEKIQLVLKSGIMETFEYELDILGEKKYYELRIVKNNGNEILAISRDITERKHAEEVIKESEYKLEYLSYHDYLTGLYNRRFFEKEIKRLDTENYLPLTTILADVNGLKLVNDSFGHTIGDELLKKVSEVIIKGCRPGDIVARLGGDEFVILLPKTDIYEAEEIAKSITNIASKEKVESVDISISLGYETKYSVEEKLEDVLKKAEDYMYKKKLFQSPSMRGKTIKTIISTLYEKNKREEQHSHRVSNLCESMGKAIGLSEYDIKELKTFGLLHDIGKIAIDDNILNNQGKLTNDEWKEMKRHPEIGYRILSTVNDMSEMAEYVLAHHERFDGMGYPKGVKGKDIPLQSRIIAIVDSYDAMVSGRSYRNALSKEVAIQELKNNAGTQFDPELVSIFIEKVLSKSVNYD